MTDYDSRPDEAQETVDRIREALSTPVSGSQSRVRSGLPSGGGESQNFDFGTLPEYEILKLQKAAGEIAGIGNPFYRLHDGKAGEFTSLEGRPGRQLFFITDYLGLNSHPAVGAAAKAAIDQFGTSVSASRLTAGERQVHRDLEVALPPVCTASRTR